MSELIFEEDKQFNTEEWKQKMSAHGESLRNNNVRQILLVHGTFTGDDALGLIHLLDPINITFADLLRKKSRDLINRLAQSVGNYTSDYAGNLGTASNIPCELFVWAGGNYHHARIQGTLDLAQYIATKINEDNILDNERLLILGHSHAGQLFALLTSFLAEDEQSQSLYQIMEMLEKFSGEKSKLIKNLKIIKKINLDFVTFGTPVRYSWGKYKKSRLMAVVNHRSKVRLSGILSTRDGDYVQQWGVEGTDMLSNEEFDTTLDKGKDISLLRANLEREKRREPKYINGDPVTETCLVNYLDNSGFPLFFLNPLSVPHCIKTLFGHGVYTQEHTMLFNLSIIVNKWYS